MSTSLSKNRKNTFKLVLKLLEDESSLPDVEELLSAFNKVSAEPVYTFTLLLLLSSRFQFTKFENKLKILAFIFERILPDNEKKLNKTFCKKWDNDSIKQYFEKTKSGTLPKEIISHSIESIIKGIQVPDDLKNPGWLNLSEDSSQIVFQMYQYLIQNCSTDDANNAFDLFLKVHFATLQGQLNFICNISSLCFNNLEIRLRNAKYTHKLLKNSSESYSWVLNLDASNVIVPTILTDIFCASEELRLISMDTFSLLSDCIGPALSGNITYLELLKHILNWKEEIILDSKQLTVSMYTLLSQDREVQKLLPTSVQPHTRIILDQLLEIITNEKISPAMCSSLLNMLEYVNADHVMLTLIPFVTNLLEKDGITPYGDIYSVANSVINKFDLNQLALFKEPQTKTLIDMCFSRSEIKRGKLSLCNSLMTKLSVEIFDLLDADCKEYIFRKLINAVVEQPDSDFLSGANSFVKRITIHCKMISPYLCDMKNVINGGTFPRVYKTSSVSETPEWQKGLKLMEFIQNKKKINSTELIIPVLFEILQKCMEVDEEISMEYTKQVCLSCILNCTEKLNVAELNEESAEKLFNVELIVNCIRVSPNPQTHHHALMLLSQCASFAPRQVLHNIMSIFTFMGSSILRQDDSFSFQIIANIMETLIPLLVKSKIRKETDLTVVRCLKVFATSVLDIPDHRRIPLLEKLIRIVGEKKFLWSFIVLVLECDVSDSKLVKPETFDSNRLTIIKQLSMRFDTATILKCCTQLLKYVNQLPCEKNEKSEIRYSRQNDLFDIHHHTNKELRHMKYSLLSFSSSILSSIKFVSELTTENKTKLITLEVDFKNVIEETLIHVQSVTKYSSKSKTGSSKYWKVLIYLSLEILNKVNALLPSDTFLHVLSNLLTHDILLVRRKMMELLNWRLQQPKGDSSSLTSSKALVKIVHPLLKIVEDSKTDDISEEDTLEVQLNCQTSLISIKLVTKSCDVIDNVNVFKKVLVKLSELLKDVSTMHGPVLACMVLCIAELTFSLKVHAIESLPKFIPTLISLLENHNSGSSVKGDIILLSIITSVHKVIESLPNFLSPYLESILYQICVLCTRLYQQYSEDKISPFVPKLKAFRQKLSSEITERVLLPSISNCLTRLCEMQEYDAIKYLMEILSESFKPNSGFSTELTSMFLTGLEFRCEMVDPEVTDKVEMYIIDALCNIALKCSESAFRPFYHKLYDWGIVSVKYDNKKDKVITYYRVLNKISEKLKSLFILFAANFIRNASELLDKNNTSKYENINDMYYGHDVHKSVMLVDAILLTLHNVFKYSAVKFVTKERFNILCEPLINQIDNTIGDYENRSTHIVDCVAHFATATTDDSLWKQFVYLVLMKTRHFSPQVRLTALETMCTFATLLGDNFLPFLPETVPFLAELLEDENELIERRTKNAVQKLESVLGEPIQKYF